MINCAENIYQKISKIRCKLHIYGVKSGGVNELGVSESEIETFQNRFLK